MSRSPAHLMTALFRNSLPLSKSRPVTRERDLLHAGLQGRQDVNVGIVAHRAGENPPGVHTSQVQRPGELAPQARAAVRNGVALEEPRLGLHLIAGLADLDRGSQQRRRFRGRDATDLVGGLRRPQVAVDRRRRHRQQLRPHRGAVPAVAVDQLAVPFQAIQLRAHRCGQVLAALPPGDCPDPLQDLQCVVGVLVRPLLTRPRRDTLPAPGGRCAALVSRRRALSRDQPVTDTTSSRIRPLSLSAALNALAYLVVISARDVIDNPLHMPHDAYRYAGIPT